MMKLNEPYLCQDFTDFLNEFLPDFEKDVRKASFDSLSAVKGAFYLGKSKKLDLQIFELSHTATPNARVALATDGFRIMKQTASFRAIMVYRSDGSDDWRLSLMTLTPEPNEKGKVSVKFSNPRRYSFFLGPNAKINTPHSFLVKKGKVEDFENLQDRFSLEVVNKEFYQEIAELYTKLVGGVRGSGTKKKKYKGIIELPSVSPDSQVNHEFAVRLIGRIIFCWFLREKKSDSGLPLVPKELLSLDTAKDTKDYYHDQLEPLFFEILNKQVKSRKEKYAKDHYAQIPYLNGGLFSPQEDDYYSSSEGKQAINHNTVKIPDEWLVELFEVLERYNFTVDENTSVDIDLSIDPEMLGRIFENLLAEINPETGESARKSTGSYYTPRTIVEYMVDKSLYQYLKDKTDIEENKLRALSSYDISDDEKYPLNQDEKEKVIEALSTVTILDPACGSGAFPIGALQKIVFMLQRVDPDAKLWFQRQITTTTPEVKKLLEHEFEHKNFDYIRKLGVIRKSIFGVDIQPIATEISRLRCFLTLVVEETVKDNEPNRGVQPLPNLDFKFVTANSLIGLPKTESPQQAMFDNYQKIDELKSVRDEYFNSSGIEREQLKTDFVMKQKRLVDELIKEHGFMGVAKAELTQKLTDWEPFSHKPATWFDPEWMYGIKDGFDIVIANPPYINISNLEKEDRNIYKKIFKVTKNKVDLYAYFVERGVELLKKLGVMTYIIPHTWKATTSFAKFRKLIFENYEILSIVNLDYGTFDATVKPLVLVLKNNNLTDYKIRILDKEFKHLRYIDLKEIIENNSMSIDTTSSDKEKSIFNKIENDSTILENICKFTRGIKTSNDARFIRNEAMNSDCRKVIRGRNIIKYKYFWGGEYIWYRPDMMKEKVGSLPHNKELFEVSEKLILQRVSKGLVGCYDSQQVFTLDTCLISNFVTLDKSVNLKYLLALINCKLLNFWFRKKFPLPTVSGYELHQLPIKVSQQKKYTKIVDSILSITNLNNYQEDLDKQNQVKNLEYQIDQLVYQLYGLTKEEIDMVENSLKE